MSDVPLHMFGQNGPKLITKYHEGDYMDSSFSLFYFQDFWFTLYVECGSCNGVEGWLYESAESHHAILRHIVDGIEPQENVWQVASFEYGKNEWMDKLALVMKEHNCFARFEIECASRREQLIIKNQKLLLEQERQELAKKAAVAERLGKAELERIQEIKELLVDVDAFFEAGEAGDPFFHEKIAAKGRLRSYCIQEIAKYNLLYATEYIKISV